MVHYFIMNASKHDLHTHTHSTLKHSTQHNKTQHNTTQHYATQHNTTLHNTTQHNTTLHFSTQHNTRSMHVCMYESINRHAAVWMKMMTRYRLIDRSTCLLDQSVFCCSLRSEMQTWTHTPANDGVRSIDCQTHWLTDTRYRRYRRTIEQSKES